MIDLELTEEHLALQNTVREFCAGEVAPYIKEWDEKSYFEPSVFRKMADLGLLGVCIPEEYGGAGFDYVSLGLVCEELEALTAVSVAALTIYDMLKAVQRDIQITDIRLESKAGGKHDYERTFR